MRAVDLSSKKDVFIVSHIDLVLGVIPQHLVLCCYYLNRVDSVLGSHQQFLVEAVLDWDLLHVVEADGIHVVATVVDELVHGVVAAEDEDLLVGYFHLYDVFWGAYAGILASGNLVASIFQRLLPEAMRVGADESCITEFAALFGSRHGLEASKLEQQLTIQSHGKAQARPQPRCSLPSSQQFNFAGLPSELNILRDYINMENFES